MKDNIKNKREIRLLNESIEDLNEESTNTIEELDNIEKENTQFKEYNNKLYNNLFIFHRISMILSIILMIQNLYIFNYILNIYYDIFIYYTVKYIIDTNYYIINIPLLCLVHFLIYRTCLYFNIKNEHLYNKIHNFFIIN